MSVNFGNGIFGCDMLPPDLPDAGNGACCMGAVIYGKDRCTCWEPVDPVLFARIAARCIADENGHWIWQLSKQKKTGHGWIRINGRTVSTHRAMFLACFGAIEHQVNHRCGVSSCQNPAHLYDGTQAENMQDAKQHGTLYVPVPPMREADRCGRGHLFNEANTLVHTRASGDVERICRICHRDRQRSYAQAGAK